MKKTVLLLSLIIYSSGSAIGNYVSITQELKNESLKFTQPNPVKTLKTAALFTCLRNWNSAHLQALHKKQINLPRELLTELEETQKNSITFLDKFLEKLRKFIIVNSEEHFTVQSLLQLNQVIEVQKFGNDLNWAVNKILEQTHKNHETEQEKEFIYQACAKVKQNLDNHAFIPTNNMGSSLMPSNR